MATVGNGYQTGSADPGFYQNALKNLITNPNSFSGTPGYQFALDQGLQAVNRSNAAMRNSGNALLALQKTGEGLASQNYGQYLSQLGQLAGQAQNYDLGLAGANNTAQGNANALALGNAQNANVATRNANDLRLGLGQNANTATRNANDYSLGQVRNANDYSLGQDQLGLGYFNGANNYALGAQQNANQAQNNWWNYSLGASQNQNAYNLGQSQIGLGYYNADTNRGQAQSNAWLGDQRNQLDWMSVYPRQRVAGQP